MGMIMNYIMSWYPEGKVPLSETKIILAMQRLSASCSVRQMNLQKQSKLIQSNLVLLINQESKLRSPQGQRAMIETLLRKSQQVAALSEIIRCSNIVKQNAKILQFHSSSINQACCLAICSIIYAYGDLLKDAVSLKDFVPQPYPKIDQKYISQGLREYVQYKGASDYAINVYALEMCNRNGISLSKVNESGHSFVQNPEKPQKIKKMDRESRSSAMFALSYDEYMTNEIEKQKEQGLQYN